MKICAIIMSAVALGAVAAPAFAAAQADARPFKATYDAKRDKYCVSQKITGQNIPVRDCRSREEWAAAGAVFGDEAQAKKDQNTRLARQ